MKRAALLLALALIAACKTGSEGSAPPVVTPQSPPVASRAWAVTVQTVSGDVIGGATVALAADGQKQPCDASCVTTAAGYVGWSTLPIGAKLVIEVGAEGYVAGRAEVMLEAGSPDLVIRLGRVVPPFPGYLVVQGRELFNPDGKFVMRGLTGFRLAHMVATGDRAGAAAWLDKAKARGVNLVRVLTTAALMFDLSPEAGRAALPTIFELARERQMYVKVVANADTAIRDYDWKTHGRLVAEACAVEPACGIYAFANETNHPTMLARFHDAATVDADAREAVAGLNTLIWTAGAPLDDEATEPGGKVYARHLDRGRDRAFDMIRRLREFEMLSGRSNVVVLNDEPIGFDEKFGGSTGVKQRINDCAVAFAMGVESRIFEAPTVFHLEAGLQVDPLGPKQTECLDAFIRGTRIVPDNVRLSFRNAGAAGSPVRAACFKDFGPASNCSPDEGSARGVVRVFSGEINANEWVTIAIGIRGDPSIEWNVAPNSVLADLGTVKVWRVLR